MRTIIALLLILLLAGCAAPQAPPAEPAVTVTPAQQPEPAPAPVAEPAPVVETAPAPPAQETLPGPTTGRDPIILKQGYFKKVVHPTSGKVTIYLLPSGEKILEMMGFDTTPGPGLAVVLHSGDVKNGFAVGSLQAAQGNYPYDLPKDLDVSKYTRVAIYNKKYNVIYGQAELR
jgi:hypothetical protein